jgi:hypothetical protein
MAHLVGFVSSLGSRPLKILGFARLSADTFLRTMIMKTTSKTRREIPTKPMTRNLENRNDERNTPRNIVTNQGMPHLWYGKLGLLVIYN